MDATYYIDRQKRLMADLDEAMQRARPAVMPLLGAEHMDEFLVTVRQEYATFIPQLPYIGGKANRLTTNLVQSVWCLAIYRVLRAQGMTLEQISKIIYQAYAAQMGAFPVWVRRLMGVYMMSSFQQSSRRRAALVSQQRQYPEDWVYDFVPGDGHRLIFGIDYHECGIMKFLQAQGAPELSPYLCKLDYAMCEALGLNLVRTQTIAEGAAYCDFRFYRG